MSFFDSLVDLGRSAYTFLTGNSTGSNIVRTLLTGYALNQVTRSINPGTAAEQTRSTPQNTNVAGTTVQLQPATENRVPVIYGRAFVSGAITDARMSADNQIMTFCVTICEVTGNKLSDGLPSQLTFEDVYIDNNRIIFDTDGITASYMVDPNGNINRTIDGLIKVYCFNSGSLSPVVPDNYTASGLLPAYNRMPGWTSNHTMNSLAFAIVQVTYNQEKNITQLPNMRFVMRNSMTMPGDCLYDYMTNNRYGAGIDPAEIKSA